jgi:hypothetical protein
LYIRSRNQHYNIIIYRFIDKGPTIELAWGGLWFFVSFRNFFLDNARVRIFIFFVALSARLYDKDSESDYLFFSSTKIRIFFLEKNHNPLLQVKWSFPNVWYYLFFIFFSIYKVYFVYFNLKTYVVYIFMSTMKYRVSGWLLYCSTSAIFQLYHGENKLHFNKMMIMSAFSKANTLSWIFILLVHGNINLQLEMTLHSDTLYKFQANQSLFLLINAACIAKKQTYQI